MVVNQFSNVTWDEDSTRGVAETVGLGGAIWTLYLALESPVGAARTSDFHSEAGSVKSYAKRIGLEEPNDPVVKEGYKNISRKNVVDADGNYGVINKQDKPHIVRLSSLGVELAAAIDNNEEIENSIKKFIGADYDKVQDPWWPVSPPDRSNEIYLRTFSDRSLREDEEAEIHVIATFDCLRCGSEIEHEYSITLNNGNPVNGWSRSVEAECGDCGLMHEHKVGDPHEKPSPI